MKLLISLLMLIAFSVVMAMQTGIPEVATAGNGPPVVNVASDNMIHAELLYADVQFYRPQGSEHTFSLWDRYTYNVSTTLSTATNLFKGGVYATTTGEYNDIFVTS